MRINSVDSTTFGVNLNSPKLRFKQQDFFVKIRGYGQNRAWANEVISTADTAVNLIRKNTSAENVLKYVAAGVRLANHFCMDIAKRNKTGVLRTFREDWRSQLLSSELITHYSGNRYEWYKERLDKVCQNPLSTNNPKVGITRPTNNFDLEHGNSNKINSSLNYVFDLSYNIIPKFIHQDVKPKDMDKVNKTIAEIRWVLAHSTPWSRGSDAIANVFMRAIYKAIGIKSYPLKPGISLDLEAYCTELEDYKKHFTSYFENPPQIIE